MILIDVNLLIYAIFRDSARHEAAHTWLDATLGGSEPVALPWAVLSAFVRLSTNPRVVTEPLTPEEALSYLEQWLSVPTVRVVEPSAAHLNVFSRIVREVRAAADLVADAHLAAIAIEHGCRVASTDSDFARFPGLQWFNPVADR